MMLRGHKVRVGLLLGLCALVYVCVLARLFWVQVMRQDFFSTLATQQYVVGAIGSNPRGEIFDRYGHSLVLNKEVQSAFILPHSATDRDELLNFLHVHYPNVLQRIIQHPEKYFFWLERRLTAERYTWLKEQKLSAIQFASESVRYYPHPELAHVLGFTDIDNRGIAGLELSLDKKLAGEASRYRMAKDARAKRYYFERTTEKEGVSSNSVHLTLDHKLQFLIYEDLAQTVEHFKALQGAAMVLNPFTGEILSMVTYPSFDPNAAMPADLALTKNVAVTECYEVGSVMKTFAALAGLAEGVVKFDEEIDCGGAVSYLQGLRIEHRSTKPLGKLPFHEAVRKSSNLALAKMGLRLGSKLYDHLSRVGFGRKTHLGFPGERPGFINPPHNWSRFSVMVMTFGYEVTVTLLQIARAMAIIANGGYYIEPFIMRDEKSSLSTNKLTEPPLYSSQNLEEIVSILEKVGERFSVPGFKLKGKTGTARMVVDGHYSAKKHLYTFAGFVEKDHYRRVVVSFIKEPEKANLWASEVTAPLAQKIAERLAIHDFNKEVHAQ